MQTVELVPAWFWYCDECGRGNFENSIEICLDSPEAEAILSQDEIQELLEMTGVGKPVLMSQPKEVKCKHCSHEFRTLTQEELED